MSRTKFKRELRSAVIKFKNFKVEDSIIIFSEPRGGSTWLMEIFLHIPGTISNWEPLHVNKGVVSKKYELGWYPHIPSSLVNKEYQLLFQNILILKYWNEWTIGSFSVKKILNGHRIITKFVRANQLLPWFVKSFSGLKHPPIFLLRHPITTCISQLKTFHDLDGEALTAPIKEKSFAIPNTLNNQRFKENKEYIEKLQSPLERQVALWCLNNINLINHNENGKWLTVFYEHLVIDPEQQLSRIIDQLQLNIGIEYFNSFNFKTPSKSDFKQNFKKNKKVQLESSFNSLDEEMLVRIQGIFDYFGLRQYSAFDPYPLKELF